MKLTFAGFGLTAFAALAVAAAPSAVAGPEDDFLSVISDLQGATDWSDYQIGVLIGASTAAFCPQYQSKIT